MHACTRGRAKRQKLRRVDEREKAKARRLATQPLPPATRCCAQCDYDLRGSVGGACPECGQVLSAAALAVARERSFFRRLVRRLAVWLALVAIITPIAIAVLGEHTMYVAPLLFLLIAPVAPLLLAVDCSRRVGE